MRVILGLDAPTAGRATIGGRPYARLSRPLHEVGALLASYVTASAAAATAAARPVPSRSGGRRPELDVARALVVAGLVVFHSAMVSPMGS